MSKKGFCPTIEIERVPFSEAFVSSGWGLKLPQREKWIAAGKRESNRIRNRRFKNRKTFHQ